MINIQTIKLIPDSDGNANETISVYGEVRKISYTGATSQGSLWISTSGTPSEQILTSSNISGAFVGYINAIPVDTNSNSRSGQAYVYPTLSENVNFSISGAGSPATVSINLWSKT